MCNFKYLYDISLKPKNYEKILSNLSIEDNNIPEVLLKHRNQVFKNIKEIMEIDVSEEDMKTDDVLRLYNKVNSKVQNDLSSREILAKKQNAKMAKRNNIMQKYSIKKPLYEN